jgi:hypothetical protein
VNHRARLAVAGLVLAAFAGGVCVWTKHEVAEPPELPAVLAKDEGGLRFTYHVASGQVALYDLAKDPTMLKNLAAERPADVRRMRQEMEKAVGVKSLEEIRLRQKEMKDRLHRLGYF